MEPAQHAKKSPATCKCQESKEESKDVTPPTDGNTSQRCCLKSSPSYADRNRSASRMILSLCCFVAAMYFYIVPSFFTANITEFLRGILTATFIFVGLVVFRSKPEIKQPSAKE